MIRATICSRNVAMVIEALMYFRSNTRIDQQMCARWGSWCRLRARSARYRDGAAKGYNALPLRSVAFIVPDGLSWDTPYQRTM